MSSESGLRRRVSAAAGCESQCHKISAYEATSGHATRNCRRCCARTISVLIPQQAQAAPRPSGDAALSEFSARYKRLVLALLTLAYSFNAMDRGIISIIGQAMKVDLRLSDT